MEPLSTPPPLPPSAATSAAPSVSVTFQLPEAEYVALLRTRVFKSFLRRKTLWLLLLSALLFLPYSANRPLILVPLTLAAVYLLTIWLAPRKFVSHSRHLNQLKTLTFDSTHVSLQSADIQSRAPWSLYFCWDETDQYFLLDFTAGGYCAAIPKAAMSAEDQETWRKLASAQLPRYPQKRTPSAAG